MLRSLVVAALAFGACGRAPAPVTAPAPRIVDAAPPVADATPDAAPVPAPDPVLRAADLAADAALVRTLYLALHPGLFRYQTPAEFDARAAELARAWDHDQPISQAFLALTRFTATIRCGHTYPNFYNQRDAVVAQVFDHRDRVPVMFRWLDGHAVITRNLTTEAALAPGTELVAIDGTAMAQILAALLPLTRADGHNDDKRLAELAVTGSDRWEAFDVYWPLAFPGRGPRPRLTVRSPDGVTATVEVDAITSAERHQQAAPPPPADGAVWTLAIDGDLAVLRMPTWALYDSAWDWRTWLDGAFAELARRRVPALAIDLRDNEGGIDVGARLLAHLIARPITRAAYQPRVRYRAVPDDLRPYLDTWDRSFFDWGAAAVGPDADGLYRLDRADDDTTPVAPLAPRYRGRVFAILGAANSSATFQFASELQRLGLGTLVGQPTGGNQRGINGGGLFFARLPRTGLEVDIPLIGQFPVAPRPDAGLAPDLLVEVTARDIAAGIDPELTAIRAALRHRAPARPSR